MVRTSINILATPDAKTMYVGSLKGQESQKQPPCLLERADCRLIQLAIGWNSSPETRAIVHLSSRFRSAVLRELLLIKTEGRERAWSAVSESVRESVMDMSGKNAAGQPLENHRHTEFLMWSQNRVPTRLLVWRSNLAFDADEQSAILRAASRDISYSVSSQQAANNRVRLIPLDEAVPPPPGFDGTPVKTWESMTPYVPPRFYLRSGKPRASETVGTQIRRELLLRGIACGQKIEIDETDEPDWVKVHIPRRATEKQRAIDEKRAYWLRLMFPEPVAGPLRLGHSSSFGLGLFKPA